MRTAKSKGPFILIIYAVIVLILSLAVPFSSSRAAKKDETPPVYAGYSVKDLYPDLAEDLKLPREQKGLLITGIYQGSAAEKAGLREGDVIVKILDAKGKSVDVPDFAAYSKTVDSVKPGRPVTLTFLRDGEEITASLTRLPGPLGKLIQPAAGEQPRTIKVAKDGSGDCKTLEASMLLARRGDTILIKKAAANNADLIYEGVSITRDNLTIASLDPQAPAAVGALQAEGLSGLQIRDLTIRAAPNTAGTAKEAGVAGSNLNNPSIVNCRIQGFNKGIWIGQSSGIIVDGNIITGNVRGIQVSDSAVKITRNFIAKNSGGVAIYASKAEIYGNTIIENNVSADIFADGVFLSADSPLFSGFIRGFGVMLDDNSIVNIYNNIIAYNNIGCIVRPGAQVTVEYNDVFQNLVAPVTKQGETPAGRYLVQIKAANADFLNGIEQAIIPGETKTYLLTPVLQFRPSTTNLSVDPLFADRMNGDYRLAADSPLAGKGRGGSYIGAFPPVSGKSGAAVAQALPKFGISARPVNADDRKTLGLPTQNGLLVTKVDKDSPAEQLGLRVGDVLLAVNGVAIKSTDQLKEVLTAGEVKSVKVFRGGAEVLLEAAKSF